MRVFFVVDVDSDFGGSQSEAALWLEGHLDYGNMVTEVVAYFKLADMVLDAKEKKGVFE